MSNNNNRSIYVRRACITQQLEGSEDRHVDRCARRRRVLRRCTGLGADHHGTVGIEDVALGSNSASLIPPCEKERGSLN